MRSQAVLVVEDEAAVALELGLLLQSFGCRVLGPAFTVRDALKMVEAERPDAAFVGGELVTSLRRRSKRATCRSGSLLPLPTFWSLN